MARQVLQQDKRALMLTQTPGKLMMSLSLPAIVGMAVIGLYTFMDAVYAGQLIGMEAMGAVAVAYPFTFINSGGASMIGMGSASVLSRAIGAKDQRTIDQVMGNLVVMNLVLSLTVTIVGTVFARPLLALTGAQGQVLDLAESYLRIMLVGSLFVNFAQARTWSCAAKASWRGPWPSWEEAPSSTWCWPLCSSWPCATKGSASRGRAAPR